MITTISSVYSTYAARVEVQYIGRKATQKYLASAPVPEDLIQGVNRFIHFCWPPALQYSKSTDPNVFTQGNKRTSFIVREIH